MQENIDLKKIIDFLGKYYQSKLLKYDFLYNGNKTKNDEIALNLCDEILSKNISYINPVTTMFLDKHNYLLKNDSEYVLDLYSLYENYYYKYFFDKYNNYVYFIKNTITNKIKISSTSNFEKRIKSIQGIFRNQMGFDDCIEVVCIIDCGWIKASVIEDCFHDIYSKYRCFGEWFDIPKEEINKILTMFDYDCITQREKYNCYINNTIFITNYFDIPQICNIIDNSLSSEVNNYELYSTYIAEYYYSPLKELHGILKKSCDNILLRAIICFFNTYMNIFNKYDILCKDFYNDIKNNFDKIFWYTINDGLTNQHVNFAYFLEWANTETNKETVKIA